MIFRFIHWLKRQPPFLRNQIVFVIALFCTAIVGGVWVTTLPAQFADFDGIGSQVANVAEKNKEIVGDVKDMVDTAKSYNAGAKSQSDFIGTIRDAGKIEVKTGGAVLLETSPDPVVLIGTTTGDTSPVKNR